MFLVLFDLYRVKTRGFDDLGDGLHALAVAQGFPGGEIMLQRGAQCVLGVAPGAESTLGAQKLSRFGQKVRQSRALVVVLVAVGVNLQLPALLDPLNQKFLVLVVVFEVRLLATLRDL